jgi:hypothetical protein
LYKPATVRDFLPQTILVVVLLLTGGWIGLSDYQGWFTVVVLASIFLGLGYETHKTAAYWAVSMGGEK